MTVPAEVVFHRGLAEALGVSQADLERMTLRELSDLAFSKGGRLSFRAHGGVGSGLTLTNEALAAPVPEGG